MMLPQVGILTLMVALVTGLNPDPIVEIVYEKGDTVKSAPVSSKLVINKTEKVEIGKPFMMSCSVPDQDASDIELCTWRRDGASEMFVQESGLYGYMRSKVQGITVLSSDKKCEEFILSSVIAY